MLEHLLVGLVALVVHVAPRVVHADKVDDFKEAARKRGCEAIPYSSERSECEDQQRRKDSVYTQFGCSRSEVQKRLDLLKEKRQNLADAKSRNNSSAIPSLENAIKEIEDDLRVRKAIAEKRVTRCQDCITARERVQRVFANAVSRVKAESDPALQPYVKALVEHFEKGALEHVTPLNETRNALANCEWVYREINL